MAKQNLFYYLVFILAVTVCAGCAGRTPKPSSLASGPPESGGELVESPQSEFGPAPVPESSPSRSADSASEDLDSATLEDLPAEEEAAGAAAPGALKRRAESRPGLGTRWGETRDSHAAFAPFVRARPRRPFLLARVFYNDRAGISAMAAAVRSRDFGDGGRSVLDGPLAVRLLSADGNALPQFEVASRDYVVGQAGDRYVIEVTNQTAHRFEAVATVDGLDVVDGRPGSFVKRGYILEPFSSITIDGFRQSLSNVAAFRFGRVARSYASLKGMPRNVGVIGVAFFEEVGSGPIVSSEEIRLRHTADPFPERFASPPLGR